MTYKKKLIEVALPLEAINIASAHEKQPGIGAHPRGLHLWWARRPLAAARSVIFSQTVDDRSAHPDIFKTGKAQEKERQRLFRIIEDLVKWEVRLLKPAELPSDWEPTTDKRLTVWEMVHQLIRALEAGGESAAAALVAKLGSQAETARELCYRLYTLCDARSAQPKPWPTTA